MLAAFALAGAARSAEPLHFVGLDGAAVAVGPPAAGEAVVVHYWATWCPSCGPELAALEAAARACAGSGVRVLAVDVGEPAAVVRDYLAERGLALAVALDPRGRTWRRDGGRELPANLVWTEQAREVSTGPRDEAAWRAQLATLGCSGDPALR